MATALLDRIVSDHLAAKAAHRDRSEWVKLEGDVECDACGAVIFSGSVALYFPGHDRLACRDCGQAGPRAIDPDEFIFACCPPGFAG